MCLRPHLLSAHPVPGLHTHHRPHLTLRESAAALACNPQCRPGTFLVSSCNSALTVDCVPNQAPDPRSNADGLARTPNLHLVQTLALITATLLLRLPP